MWISIDDGPDQGKTVEVKGKVLTIGRHPGSDLVVTDQEASSRHATIEIGENGNLLLRDLNSTNGTLINGKKVGDPVPIDGTEQISIGRNILRLSMRSPDATVVRREPRVAEPVLAGAAAPPAPPAPPPAAAVEATPPAPPPPRATPPVPPFEPRVSRQAPPPSGGGNGWKIVAVLVAALVVVGGVVGAIVATSGGSSKPKPTTLTATQVIAAASPSVVRINGIHGAGSGFVIDARRQYVLTNAHVVVGNSGLSAQIGNNAQVTSPVQIVASDPCDDLAVVKLATPVPGLKALSLGSSGALAPGDQVTVLGYPGSLQQSLNSDQTVGQATSVVANTGTVSQVGVKATPDPSSPEYQNTVVHQAPVNHGDSGGPLLNNKGQVVGVNTLTNVNNQGQYYAIASDYIARLLPSLLAGQSRGMVGWNLFAVDANDPALQQKLVYLYQSIPQYAQDAQTIGADATKFIQSNDINGVFDFGDEPGTPAASANTSGYLITSINGDNVPTFAQVCSIISSATPGSQVKLSGLAIAPSNPADALNQLNATLTLPAT
jgi:S1-C subfamily serine protease